MLVIFISIWHFKVGNFSSLMVFSCTEHENGETQSGWIVPRIYQSRSKIHRLRHDGWWFQVWKLERIEDKLFREFREEFGEEELGPRCKAVMFPPNQLLPLYFRYKFKLFVWFWFCCHRSYFVISQSYSDLLYMLSITSYIWTYLIVRDYISICVLQW